MNEEGERDSGGGKERVPIGRRDVLKFGAALGALGGASLMANAGRPNDTTMAETVGSDLSFELRQRWRDTLPDAEWSDRNRIPLLHDAFDGPDAGARWSVAGDGGRSLGATVGNGAFEVAGGEQIATGTWTRTVEIAAPWVAVATTIEEISDAGLAIGVAKDGANLVAGGVDGDGFRIVTAAEGEETVARFGGTVPTGSFEAMLILMGDRASLLTRPPGGEWSYRGDASYRNDGGWFGADGVDLYERAEWADWNPCLRVDVAADGRVVVGDVRAFHTLQFGLRDPTVVTTPDGLPLQRDGELFFTATCGSVDARGYQVVLAMDDETYEFDLRAALWAESVPGYVSNYVASHVLFDPDEGEFVQCWSGFGNGPHEPYAGQKCWVSRTDGNVLDGTHVLPCERMNLPLGWTRRQHDPFVIRDEEAGAWRCVHNENAIHRIAVSETTDDSLTGGWRRVANHRDYLHQIEGGKLARVGGEIALAYADQGSENHMTLAAYPDPSRGRIPIDVDVPPGDVAPHPSIVPLPDGGKETRYLLVTMDGERIFGLGEPSHGALLVYEAAVEDRRDVDSTAGATSPTGESADVAVHARQSAVTSESTAGSSTASGEETADGDEMADGDDPVVDDETATESRPDLPTIDDRIRGAVYFPARAFNGYQVWADYDAEEVRRDVGYAARLNLNALQVLVSYEYWREAPKELERRFEDFLVAASEAGIAVLPMLFESIGDRPTEKNLTNTDLETAFAVHSPDRGVIKLPWRWGGPRSFVEWFVDRFGGREGVLAVSIMNEPGEWGSRVSFCRSMLEAARETNPDVPLTMGCKDLQYNRQYEEPELDVYQFHYNLPPTAEHMRDALREAERVAEDAGKPVWLTEWQRTLEEPPDRMLPNYESLAPVIRESDLDGDVLWQLMLKPAYMEKPRKRGRLNGIFHEDGVPYSVGDARTIAGLGTAAPLAGESEYAEDRPEWPAWTQKK